MISEITIKISFVHGAGEVSTGSPAVTLGGVEIQPPEAPKEAQEHQIPPPPTLEEALGETGAAVIPPPPDVELQAEAGVPLPPEE